MIYWNCIGDIPEFQGEWYSSWEIGIGTRRKCSFGRPEGIRCRTGSFVEK